MELLSGFLFNEVFSMFGNQNFFLTKWKEQIRKRIETSRRKTHSIMLYEFSAIYLRLTRSKILRFLFAFSKEREINVIIFFSFYLVLCFIDLENPLQINCQLNIHIKIFKLIEKLTCAVHHKIQWNQCDLKEKP